MHLNQSTISEHWVVYLNKSNFFVSQPKYFWLILKKRGFKGYSLFNLGSLFGGAERKKNVWIFCTHHCSHTSIETWVAFFTLSSLFLENIYSFFHCLLLSKVFLYIFEDGHFFLQFLATDLNSVWTVLGVAKHFCILINKTLSQEEPK